MEEKKADNRLLEIKKKNNKIDNKLAEEHNLINKLDSIEEELYSLKKTSNNCIELIRLSMKGGNINRVLESMIEDNKEYFSNTFAKIEEQRKFSQDRIKNLNQEKDKLKEKYNDANENYS